MKTLLHFFFALSLSVTALAGPPSGIVSAIGSGDCNKLSAYLDSNVDIKILNKENVYSNAQAQLIIKDFFQNYPPLSFSIFHEGGPENAAFAIGKLKTSKGDFRVYFLIKKKGDSYFIQKFRIEEEEASM